jgi:hypothetical protein
LGPAIRAKTNGLQRCVKELRSAIDANIRNKASGGRDFESDRAFGAKIRATLTAQLEDDANKSSKAISESINGIEELLRPRLGAGNSVGATMKPDPDLLRRLMTDIANRPDSSDPPHYPDVDEKTVNCHLAHLVDADLLKGQVLRSGTVPVAVAVLRVTPAGYKFPDAPTAASNSVPPAATGPITIFNIHGSTIGAVQTGAGAVANAFRKQSRPPPGCERRHATSS